jgi:hypothetical protein
MDDDVAGLADIYGGSVTSFPPESLYMESFQSSAEVPESRPRGIIRGIDYLPPEEGISPIPKLVSNTLIPGEKRAKAAPDTLPVTEIEITDARNDWQDTYGGEAGWTDDSYGAPVYDREGFFGRTEGGIYDTFVSGGLSDLSPSGPSKQTKPTESFISQHSGKILIVGVGAVAIYWFFLRNK